MKLKSFGCSFIFGDELSDNTATTPSNLTWPALLASYAGYKYECYANRGIGNLQILNTLLSHISSPHSDSVYIINWTWPERFNYIHNGVWKTLQPTTNDWIATAYYKNLHADYTDKLSLLMCITTATSILEQNKLRYIMTYMDNQHITPTAEESELNTLYKNALPYLTHWDGHGFNAWCEINEFEKCPGNHWTESAQQSAFEYIKDQFVQKGL